MKLLTRRVLALGMPLLFTACATVGPPLPPSLELPKPPADLRATRKGDKVTLTWTIPAVTTDRQAVRSMGSTRICRGGETSLTQCGAPVGVASPQAIPVANSPRQKISGTYTDTLPLPTENANPSGFATYAVEVLNADGRGAGLSNQIRVSLARTLPPPENFAAHVTNQGIVLTWASVRQGASTGQVRYVYRIYRRQEGSQQQVLAGEVPSGGEPAFTDSSFDWGKTYEYRVETVTAIVRENNSELQVEGDDSAEVKVFADDIFPPAVPAGLQAVFSGPGQKAFIDVIWAPVTDVDLDGYNVFRHEDGAAPVRVNAELLKAPAYRDAGVVSGKRYFYSVSSVDVRGNESTRSEEASEAVP
ncbi:MAG TPA: hypothetical protein VFE61_10865 [Candidatus Sulfotelmatobacter sp.]|nr:hypothetical protein [Candidatus Sulfotelmatobacter sp.]